MFNSNNKAFGNQFLIEWMKENGVFDIIFESKRTHL